MGRRQPIVSFPAIGVTLLSAVAILLTASCVRSYWVRDVFSRTASELSTNDPALDTPVCIWSAWSDSGRLLFNRFWRPAATGPAQNGDTLDETKVDWEWRREKPLNPFQISLLAGPHGFSYRKLVDANGNRQTVTFPYWALIALPVLLAIPLARVWCRGRIRRRRLESGRD